MQSLFEKKNLPCFSSNRVNLQSAILLILSTAAAIIKQTKYYYISPMSKHFAVKQTFLVFMFIYTMLYQNGVI